jgi:hypothetical protein
MVRRATAEERFLGFAPAAGRIGMTKVENRANLARLRPNGKQE